MDIIVSEPIIDLTGDGGGRLEQPLWKVLLKATGVFVGVSFAAFGVLNARAIYQQVSDTLLLHNTNANQLTDTDADGLPDWWEVKYGLNPKLNDATQDPDRDDLTNLQEYAYHTNPLGADTDADGYPDGKEVQNGYDPTKAGQVYLDLDTDGMPDWWETKNGLDTNLNDASDDADRDGLTNTQEYQYGTNPRDGDSDHDGQLDGYEISHNLNPLGTGSYDSDHDGLTDAEEQQYHTDPSVTDSDKDGLKDGEEVHKYHTNPLSADTDGDGFKDGDEVKNGFDPAKGGGARFSDADLDGDGLTYVQEKGIGTSADNPDTDGDGINDGQEIQLGLDPTNSEKTARPQGHVSIDKLHLDPPIVWVLENTDAAYELGLESGVIHVPSTVYPGSFGNSYITGHSSDYFYKPGNFKTIFSELNNLSVGDAVRTSLTYKSGKTIVHHWRMFEKGIVSPDDPVLFRDENQPVLTLASCWPLDTSWKRLYEKFNLESVDYK